MCFGSLPELFSLLGSRDVPVPSNVVGAAAPNCARRRRPSTQSSGLLCFRFLSRQVTHSQPSHPSHPIPSRPSLSLLLTHTHTFVSLSLTPPPLPIGPSIFLHPLKTASPFVPYPVSGRRPSPLPTINSNRFFFSPALLIIDPCNLFLRDKTRQDKTYPSRHVDAEDKHFRLSSSNDSSADHSAKSQ